MPRTLADKLNIPDMLRLKTILSISALALTLASCSKKDYNCVCYGGFGGGKETLVVSKSSKSAAENQCTSYNSPPGTNDGYSGCHIE